MDMLKALKPIQTPRKAYSTGEESMEEEPLSPMARAFHKPDSNVYIITIIGLKTRVCPDIVKADLVHTVLKHPRFSSLQVLEEKDGEGMMKWVPTNVDIEKHVIVPDLLDHPDMMMGSSPDKFVEDYTSNLSKTRIDMSKPLWDLHLLNLKTSESEATAIFRIHHSLGDGTSLMSLLLASTRKTSNVETLPSIPARRPAAAGGLWYRFKLVWNTIVDVIMFLATLLYLKDTQTPLKGPHQSLGSSTPRRFIRRTVSLDDVKLVKNATHTTINDVVLGVTQAGLSRYLNRGYGEAKKDKGATEKENNLPTSIRFRATLFMNLRPSAGIHALAEMMKKGTKAKWGNQIGYVLFPFTIALRDNPLDYVREAKAAMDRKKASLEAICIFSISKLMLKLFGSKVPSFPPHTTMWFSNVIGPREEISLFGCPVAYVAPSCFGQPNALMIHVISYVNKMTFVLSVDEDAVPDPYQLCDDLEASLKLIKDAVMAKRNHQQKK